MLKRYLFLTLILLGTDIWAQKEVIKCEAIDPTYKLELNKISNEQGLKSLKPAFPFYILDTINVLKIRKLHSLVTSQQNEINELKKKIDYYDQLKVQNDTLASLLEEQKRLYQESYNQLLEINKKLSGEFDKAYELSVKQSKRYKTNSALVSILSGLVAGVTVGLILK